jgi:hypothetical protein
MSRPWSLPLVAFALALALRAVGVGFFLPHQSDPDDHAIDQLQVMQTGQAVSVFSWGKYGHLVPRAISLLPRAGLDEPITPATARAHLDTASRNHLRARWISAVLGALVVPGTFWLARAWLGPGWALVAAAFAGTSLLHVSFSQQARPHVPFTTLALFAVLAAIRLRRAPTRGNAVLFAASLFLAVGTLHSAAFLLPAGLAAVCLARGGERRVRLVAVAGMVVAVVASLAIFWPFLYGPAQTFAVAERTATNRFPHLVRANMFDGSGFGIWLDALRGYDPVLLGAAAVGAAGALARLVRWRRCPVLTNDARRDLVVALAFALSCGLTFGVFGNSFERFFLPLYPYLGLLAALALRDVTAVLARLVPRARAAIGVALAVAALALPTYAAARLVWLRSRPDTFTLAARFLANSDPSLSARTLMHPRAVIPVVGRLDESGGELIDSSAWLRYLRRKPDGSVDPDLPAVLPFPEDLRRPAIGRSPKDLAELDALDGLRFTAAITILPPNAALQRALDRYLARNGERVWQVRHEEGDRYADDGYQERDMLAVVLAARVWGPHLAIYRHR